MRRVAWLIDRSIVLRSVLVVVSGQFVCTVHVSDGARSDLIADHFACAAIAFQRSVGDELTAAIYIVQEHILHHIHAALLLDAADRPSSAVLAVVRCAWLQLFADHQALLACAQHARLAQMTGKLDEIALVHALVVRTCWRERHF